MKIIYGTGNKEKVNQLKEYINSVGLNIEIITIKEIGFNEVIIENGTTFEENSLIKAKAIKRFCDKKNIKGIIVTDDAGLCVDSLNGQPGIYSARYAGNHASQEATINKLLKNMKNDNIRTAQFVCVLTAVKENGEIVVAKGVTNGHIAAKPGTMGKLTYGPVFIPEGFDKVMNDINVEELGETHRIKAVKMLLEKIS